MMIPTSTIVITVRIFLSNHTLHNRPTIINLHINLVVWTISEMFELQIIFIQHFSLA
jgi:hypothetical protein